MADLELAERERSWLLARRVRDRIRVLEPRTRARALLELAGPAIRAARQGAPPRFPAGPREVERWAERDRLEAAMLGDLGDPRAAEIEPVVMQALSKAARHVERIAEGLACHEVVDGVAYLLRSVSGLDDPRLLGIARAAALAGISETELDDATAKLARQENAAAAIALRYQARLAETTPPPKVTRLFSRARRDEPPRRRAQPNYDTTRLVEIVASLPEEPSRVDQRRLADELLGELDEHVVAEHGEVQPLRPVVLLLAVAELIAEVDGELRRAAAEKARRLAVEYPRASGRERDYMARAGDLDASLVQPHRELLGHLRRVLVTQAYRVARPEHWPGDREQRKHERALALAASIRETISPHERALARAQLGFGTTTAL